MNRCLNCKAKLKWKQIFIGLMSINSIIICESCKEKLRVTITSRIIVAGLVSLPLLFSTFIISRLQNFSFVVYLIYGMAILLISPFFVVCKK